MFGGLLNNARGQIDVAEALINTHDEYIKLQPVELQGPVKVYAVSSCVTRLYAIYEHFFESLIADFLDTIPELTPYASLSDGLKTEYRIGISHVLSKIDSERYRHLSHENVIRWYHEALTNSSKYRFVSEALTRHDQNLRLSIVEALVSRIDLNGVREWLIHCSEIGDLYEEKTSLFEQLQAELKTFVQARNDAAHGVLEILEGKEILLRYCSLIRALITAIAAYFHMNLLRRRTEAGLMRRIGEVTEIFEKAGAFVAQLDVGCEVQSGMSVHLVGPSYCAQQKIESLQINGVDVDKAVADQPAFEVGLKFAVISRKAKEIFVDAIPLLEQASPAESVIIAH